MSVARCCFEGGLNMLLNGSVKRFGVGVGCVEVESAEYIETDYLSSLNSCV